MTPAQEKKLAVLSRKMVENILDYIGKQEANYGREFGDSLALSFLASYAGALIFSALVIEPDKPILGAIEKAKFQSQNLGVVKHGVEQAVAAGVGGAMTTYINKPVEFYCQIKQMPPVASKLSS